MKKIYDTVSARCSRITTRAYSTSFSVGIFCLHQSLRDPIYSIYGFVRLADEIVDSFHGYDKRSLLTAFKADTHQAIKDGISLNPILNSFQHTVNRYKIDDTLIDCFLYSMEMDLATTDHDAQSFSKYVLGSAEVVGLMCLRVFCNGDHRRYEQLKPNARSLGAAFQKVNFLRDMNADFNVLGRTYFPGINPATIDDRAKRLIEESIDKDFQHALQGIRGLPRTSRLGVYVAYVYYRALFNKIKNTPSGAVVTSRIRIRNRDKARLLAWSYVKHQFNLIK